MQNKSKLGPNQPATGMLSASVTVDAHARVSAVSKFQDSEWLMASMTHHTDEQTSWDYKTLPGFPAGFALSAAEFAYHRLYKPVSTHDRTGLWPTIVNELVCVRQFSEFCWEVGCENLSDVDLEVYHEFVGWMSFGSVAKSAERRRYFISTLYKLWEYGPTLSQPLIVLPFGKSKKAFLGRAKQGGLENRTPVIPDSVFAPLSAAALDYVLKFSSPVLRAYRQMCASWSEIDSTGLSPSGKLKRLARGMADILDSIACPWRKEAWKTQEDVYQEMHQLKNACTIVILAFSGVRLAELLSLEAGCAILDMLPGGRKRHYLNSIVRKHRGVHGAKDSWVVIEEVHRAVEILEMLTADLRFASSDKRLFLSTGSNSPFSVTSSAGAALRVARAESLTYRLNSFVRTSNLLLSRAPIPDHIGEDGVARPWHLTPRQFRRTLAKEIARQPFGIIAGMRQYKHVETACFEGYAGLDPDWNKMLEEEKVLASINILEELAMDLSNGSVSGTVGKKLLRMFDAEFRGRAEQFAPSQILKWLGSEKRQLFVGKFNFCFFKKEEALCIKDSENKEAPIVNACDPSNCSNSCVAKKHVPLWTAQRDQALNLMKQPKASLLQLMALKGQVDQLETVLSPLIAADA